MEVISGVVNHRTAEGKLLALDLFAKMNRWLPRVRDVGARQSYKKKLAEALELDLEEANGWQGDQNFRYHESPNLPDVINPSSMRKLAAALDTLNLGKYSSCGKTYMLVPTLLGELKLFSLLDQEAPLFTREEMKEGVCAGFTQTTDCDDPSALQALLILATLIHGNNELDRSTWTHVSDSLKETAEAHTTKAPPIDQLVDRCLESLPKAHRVKILAHLFDTSRKHPWIRYKHTIHYHRRDRMYQAHERQLSPWLFGRSVHHLSKEEQFDLTKALAGKFDIAALGPMLWHITEGREVLISQSIDAVGLFHFYLHLGAKRRLEKDDATSIESRLRELIGRWFDEVPLEKQPNSLLHCLDAYTLTEIGSHLGRGGLGPLRLTCRWIHSCFPPVPRELVRSRAANPDLKRPEGYSWQQLDAIQRLFPKPHDEDWPFLHYNRRLDPHPNDTRWREVKGIVHWNWNALYLGVRVLPREAIDFLPDLVKWIPNDVKKISQGTYDWTKDENYYPRGSFPLPTELLIHQCKETGDAWEVIKAMLTSYRFAGRYHDTHRIVWHFKWAFKQLLDNFVTAKDVGRLAKIMNDACAPEHGTYMGHPDRTSWAIFQWCVDLLLEWDELEGRQIELFHALDRNLIEAFFPDRSGHGITEKRRRWLLEQAVEFWKDKDGDKRLTAYFAELTTPSTVKGLGSFKDPSHEELEKNLEASKIGSSYRRFLKRSKGLNSNHNDS